VVIAIAGGSAALPGVVASYIDIPVIGVPVPTKDLRGIDSLLSMTQMPSGVPVATVGIGEGGAKNAAYLALRILALENSALKEKLSMFRDRLKEGVKKID
jgi:5-(carboxyamino)imidazole ribonucleotide mutase